MRRSLLALTAAAATAATMSAVHAAPSPVDSGRLAQAQLSVPLTHGAVLSLDLRAATLSSGNVLRIVAERCDAAGSCDELTAYQSPIPGSALSIDPNTTVATLTTSVAGRRVQLRWRPSTATAPGEIGGGDGEVDNSNNTSADAYQGENAVVSADIDGISCSTAGGVGDGLFVDSSAVTGSSGAQALSALKLPDTATIRCA